MNTRRISDKAKELSDRAVTIRLKETLARELEELGLDHIKTELKNRSAKGKAKYQLVLSLPVARKEYSLERVLSEGEQRVLAIASFLAELRLSGHLGPIVFDDPVSSLDHFRRQKVAKRLVKESQIRQVIIFTHDTLFLGELKCLLETANPPGVYSNSYVGWGEMRPGVINSGLPWEHKSYMERIDFLEKEQRRLRDSWMPYPDDKISQRMRETYSALRATIERVVQDLVLCNVVNRYENHVRVGNLKNIDELDSTESGEIISLYNKCSDTTLAHDPSSVRNAPVPSPEDLFKDIEKLKSTIANIKRRRKQGMAT